MKILIKNGRIWDGQRFFMADILTQDRHIAKIGPGIAEPVDFAFDAAGMTVAPGLVDAHVHFRGISSDTYGFQPEACCFPFGVTAGVDAGAEQGDLRLLESFMVKNGVFVCARIRDDRADLSETDALLEAFGERALGVKVFFSGRQVRSLRPLQEICAYARQKGLPVMVHCNGAPVPMAQLLDMLAPGDILTHAFHGVPNSAAEDGFASLKAAQERGVIIDGGFAGHVHTDFAVFKGAVKAGVLPDTISTDITRSSAFRRGGRYGMTMCMSMARTAGMSEEAIFRAVTSAPAAVFGMESQWGYLTPGAPADIAVLEYTDEGFCLTDKAGNCLENKMGYRCMLTVADGDIVYKY